MSTESPCLNCGACCAAFRVSFYWAEADDAPGGWVPADETEKLTPSLRCMKGTNQKAPHCAQLSGPVPGGLCRIYDQRPSPCRELEPYGPDGKPTDQCTRARAVYGLPSITP
ncbi:MAG: YkgJ family cysteine cluster protein [Fluviibacter sp.]